jgi:dGTPase
MSTARVARRVAEPIEVRDAPEGRAPDVEEFRIDLERIYLSPYLSRLTAVTQVVSQVDSNQVVHNRMTHSMKVAAVAWSIAARLGREEGETGRLIETLGGCDPVVAQAAGWAHDMGHPPFGHRGEQALDRIARDRFGLLEGFEGNAQTFRILTELDVSDAATNGLNLTAAVRAAVLKYPWARRVVHPVLGRDDVDGLLPVGARPTADGVGPSKMSAYTIDLSELEAVRAAYPALGQWQQTLESSIMDISDDITYSLHDLDDFYRAGVLQHSAVVREFRAWLDEREELSSADPGALIVDPRGPGMSLEALRRRVHHNDPWIADDDAFTDAVERVRTDLVEGLLTIPFDGSIGAQRALSSFISSWITHLQDSVTVTDTPSVRSGHVTLEPRAWHEIAVLKFVHRRFVLERPELGLLRWGQAHVIDTIVDALDRWLRDGDESDRAPARLLDMIELARRDYARVRVDRPELLEGATDNSDLERFSRGRGIIDYVASLTDGQAHAMARTITGSTDLSWGSV